MQNRFQSGRVRAAGAAGMRRGQAGLSIMELMISMTIGIFITGAVIAGFISSKTAFTRLEQISALQQNARTAFEYLTSDSRMAGHLGCFSGNDVTSSAFVNTLNSATTVPYAFAIGIEGYQATAASATVSNSPSTALCDAR